jgi:hypothetical protein
MAKKKIIIDCPLTFRSSVFDHGVSFRLYSTVNRSVFIKNRFLTERQIQRRFLLYLFNVFDMGNDEEQFSNTIPAHMERYFCCDFCLIWFSDIVDFFIHVEQEHEELEVLCVLIF